VPILAWPLIWQKGIQGKTKSAVKFNFKSLHLSLYSFSSLFQKLHLPHFSQFKFSPFHFQGIFVFCFLLLSAAVSAQEAEQFDDDPYLDPQAASAMLQPSNRAESERTYMFGISYGLNPIVILAPAVSLGMYWDPLVFGVEISDSEQLGIWEKERRENFGTSEFSGETMFVKWFFGDNFYLVAAREHRIVKLWSRTFNRISGKAKFDMFFETTLASLGAGLLRFNEIGFLAIDIIRLNMMKNHSVEVVEYWETWSEISGSREALDENIQKRSDKWANILNSPTGFVVTFGIYF
jgi:hypothetical protein